MLNRPRYLTHSLTVRMTEEDYQGLCLLVRDLWPGSGPPVKPGPAVRELIREAIQRRREAVVPKKRKTP